MELEQKKIKTGRKETRKIVNFKIVLLRELQLQDTKLPKVTMPFSLSGNAKKITKGLKGTVSR